MVQLVEESFLPRTRFYVDGWNCATSFYSFTRRTIDLRRKTVSATPPDWPVFQTNTDGLTEIDGVAADGKPGWKVVRVSSEETIDGDNSAHWAIDGIDDDRSWRTSWTEYPRKSHPHELVFDIGESRDVAGLKYSAFDNFGRIRYCQIFVSDSPDQPGAPAAQGAFSGQNRWETAVFERPVKGRYITIRTAADWEISEFAAAREIHLLVPQPK